MAANKPEIVITHERYEISVGFQRILDIFITPNTLELSSTLSDVGRQPEISMAVYTPEVAITQKRYEISAKFQRILYIFDHA